MTKLTDRKAKKYGTSTAIPEGVAARPVTIDANGGHDGYQLASKWRVIGGCAEPVLITIDRWDGAPVTATAVRNLPLGEMLKEARRAVSEMTDVLALIPELSTAAGDGAHEGFTALGPQRGLSLTQEVLEEVAQVYRSAYFNGRNVQDAVSEHFHISVDAATKRIRKARDAHLLDGIGKGREKS